MSLFATATLLATLAAATGTANSQAYATAVQYFPRQLTLDPRSADAESGFVARQLVGTTVAGPWIFAAYSDGYRGAVRVIENSASGARVVAESILGNMAGTDPTVRLLDLNADGTPEVLASFADQYGTEQYWIFGWDGQTLSLLSQTENNPVTGIDSDITDATFVDVDGDGIVEVIDHKVIDHNVIDPPADEGERTSQSLYTVYQLRNGHVASGSPVAVFEGFQRGKGKPARVDRKIAIDQTRSYRLRLINGDNAATAATSGEVWLNGASIFGPRDFQRAARIVTRTMNLTAGTNTLGVQLGGEPGSHVWILLEPAP